MQRAAGSLRLKLQLQNRPPRLARADMHYMVLDCIRNAAAQERRHEPARFSRPRQDGLARKSHAASGIHRAGCCFEYAVIFALRLQYDCFCTWRKCSSGFSAGAAVQQADLWTAASGGLPAPAMQRRQGSQQMEPWKLFLILGAKLRSRSAK